MGSNEIKEQSRNAGPLLEAAASALASISRNEVLQTEPKAFSMKYEYIKYNADVMAMTVLPWSRELLTHLVGGGSVISGSFLALGLLHQQRC